MVDDPITLMAVVVMLFAHVRMAIMAKDDSRTKGFEALLFLFCPPLALFYYLRMPKRKRPRLDCLHWLFLVSVAVVVYRVS